jgi:hypothetical protein
MVCHLPISAVFAPHLAAHMGSGERLLKHPLEIYQVGLQQSLDLFHLVFLAQMMLLVLPFY